MDDQLLAELDEDAADCFRAALSLPGRAAAEIRRLGAQLMEAHKAVWAMSDDGWLCCGDEGYSEPQQLAVNYTLKFPRPEASADTPYTP
jgi:hypothetical protein